MFEVTPGEPRTVFSRPGSQPEEVEIAAGEQDGRMDDQGLGQWYIPTTVIETEKKTTRRTRTPLFDDQQFEASEYF